jgi:serine/threonine protein phosphatase PrpC
MSRSFGDKVAASVGVSSDPEITERTLQLEDKILVLASDGVWDVLSNQAVLDLVTPFYKVGDARGAAELVCQSAENRWKEEEDVVDDITAVILFL